MRFAGCHNRRMEASRGCDRSPSASVSDGLQSARGPFRDSTEGGVDFRIAQEQTRLGEPTRQRAIARQVGRMHNARMSTPAEIEQAIERLPVAERESLENRLLSRRFGLDTMTETERAELLASLDEAERDLDEGRGLSADDLRQAVRSWAGR